MDGSDDEDLPALLAAVTEHPDDPTARVRACIAATRRALRERDPFWADVSESLAAEGLPTRAMGTVLKEQLALARQARRTICVEAPTRSGIDASDVAADLRLA